jgi:hypothetical protein
VGTVAPIVEGAGRYAILGDVAGAMSATFHITNTGES